MWAAEECVVSADASTRSRSVTLHVVALLYALLQSALYSSLAVPGAAFRNRIRSRHTSAPDVQADTPITCAHAN